MPRSISTVILFFLVMPSAFATTDSQCDYPGPNIGTEKTSDASTCAKLCAANELCSRWVYVSGWGRCALRKGEIKRRSITMWSAAKGEAPIENKDHSAKDFHKAANTADAKACAKLCEGREQCTAMTYIAGYRDCYLKTGKGKYRDKIFYCGTR